MKNIRKALKRSKVYVCEKCGWQTQKTIMTDKLKEHCQDCKCQNEEPLTK